MFIFLILIFLYPIPKYIPVIIGIININLVKIDPVLIDFFLTVRHSTEQYDNQ